MVDSNYKYKPHIDGLRALSVVSVLFYHANITGFEGGFIGVDVFFAISGYLITRIILDRLKEGKFDIRVFYIRRIRRILPVLLLVVTSTIPISWLVMMPDQFKDYCQSLVSVTLFCPNYFFYLKSGYFEPRTELMPLIHTWSLGVEEQFYFMYPIGIALLWKIRKSSFGVAVTSMTCLSFGYCLVAQSYDPSATFFLPFSRAWELLAGALLSYFEQKLGLLKIGRKFHCLVGIFLILGSVLMLDDSYPFPGVFAIPAVVGTLLVINGGEERGAIASVLASRPLVSIGLMSFSLYLWHQPLFSFARILSIYEPPPSVFISLIVVTFGLSFLSWKFVEQKVRDQRQVSTSIVLACSLGVTLLLGTFGLLGHRMDGFKNLTVFADSDKINRFNEKLRTLRTQKSEELAKLEEHGRGSFSRGLAGKKILVVGDSRGEDLYLALTLNLHRIPSAELRYQRVDDRSFRAFKGSFFSSRAQKVEVQDFVERIKLDPPDLVLLACGWDARTIRDVQEFFKVVRGIKTVVFGSASFAEIDSMYRGIVYRQLSTDYWPEWFSRNIHVPSRDASVALAILCDSQNIEFVDPYEFFRVKVNRLHGGDGYRLIDINGDPMILDQTHLSVSASRQYGKWLLENSVLFRTP